VFKKYNFNTFALLTVV